MSYVVGVMLLAAFGLFAVLMFLERLTALVALPLMALTFLTITIVADVVGPGQMTESIRVPHVSGTGTRTYSFERRSFSTRFSRWSSAHIEFAASMRAQAELAPPALERIRTLLDAAPPDLPARLQEQYDSLRTTELSLRTAWRTEFESSDGGPVFPSSSTYRGPLAKLEEQADASAPSARLRSIVAAARRPAPDWADIRSRFDRAATEILDVAAHPATAPSRFNLAAGYIGEYASYCIRAGSLNLHAAMLAIIFAGMFAMYVRTLKIAERLVYWTAEFAGEQPLIVALAVFTITGIVFTSVGGLGTVMMVGTVVLPVLRSVGLSPIVSAGLFLIAIAMGGTLYPVSRRLWMEIYEIPGPELDALLWRLVGLYAACGIGWILWGTRRALRSSFMVASDEQPLPSREKVPARLMIAPVLPVALVYFARVDEITAFALSLAYMYLCVVRRAGSLRVFVRSMIEGAQSVMPPVLLMIGIGLLVTTLGTPPVQSYLKPLISAVVPETRWGYILLFGLAAPLALYRGPLNVWGMGLAVAATLLATSTLPPAAILAAILAAGMLQGICDPTNTANVWIASFQGVTANQILRYTLVPVWLAAVIAVTYFGIVLVD